MIGLRTALCLGSAALLAGCAPNITRTGTPVWPGGVRTFVLGTSPAGHESFAAEADAAVRDVLAARGFTPAADARYRVDVGFAITSGAVEIAPPAGQSRATRADAGPILCKPRQYVLSVAMIDRGDGKVLFRSGASTRRCAEASPTFLPLLARAALGG